MSAEPGVSVVIPTLGRPRLLLRAVESALGQSRTDLEILVVVDGPDQMTVDAVSRIADPRVRIVPRRSRGGGGAARNSGVQAARARWIAFLDDDDWWEPGKLETQIPVAAASRFVHPVVASRIVADRGSGPKPAWPRRLPAPDEPLGDYLFVRRSAFWGEALVHPSTLLVDRALLEAAPFREDILVHEDYEWLLRALRVPGAGLEFLPQALATWSVDAGRWRASRDRDWRDSLEWGRLVRPLLSRRAYAAFLLTFVGAHAARVRSFEGLWRLPLEAVRSGRPRLRDVLMFAGFWVVPESLRDRLAARIASAND